MNLDPHPARYLERDQERPRWEGMAIDDARELARAWHLEHAVFRPQNARLRMQVTTRNLLVPGPGHDLPVRLYQPPADGPLPLVVFFHGGGYVAPTDIQPGPADSVLLPVCTRPGQVSQDAP